MFETITTFFEAHSMAASIGIFLIAYFFIATEKIEKSIAAIGGAVAVIALGLITFEDAVHAIDLNVIFLLIGMMTCVSILAETGFFEWVAIYIAKLMKGDAVKILVSMLIVTMIFSALLDNVTTIILLAPVTILISQLLEIPTLPFLILEAIASNIGGTATLIGDPPNIIIGSMAELSFNDFLINLSPGVAIIAVVFIISSVILMRKHLNVPDHIKERVNRAYPELAIRDSKNMKRSLVVFLIIFIGFFIHHSFDLEPGIVALGGMCIMLVVCKSHTENMLKAVEWDAILFFIGLFIMIGALEENGVIELLAKLMLNTCGDNMLFTAIIVLCGSAFFSAILDNIPFVIAMTPLVQKLIVHSGGEATGVHPLFWALALGACLGGNGTLIGASANVVASKIGARNGYPITFMTFLKYGIPFTIQSVVIAVVYLWLRYFYL
jgi:Na+/H+ antiporter NhaD/arsenite permease-like protein